MSLVLQTRGGRDLVRTSGHFESQTQMTLGLCSEELPEVQDLLRLYVASLSKDLELAGTRRSLIIFGFCVDLDSTDTWSP